MHQIPIRPTLKRIVGNRLSQIAALAVCVAAPALATTPRPSQYLIKPWETSRLTACDVVGPDGIVYPDFRRVGMPGGIPDLKDPAIAATYKEFPVPPGADNAAVAAVMKAAIAHAKTGGRSLVKFAEGNYRLSAALPKIDASNVVVTGAGMDKTLIELVPGGGGRALFDTGPRSPWAGASATVSGAVPRGATRISVASSKGFAVGDVVYLGTVMPGGLPPEATMRKRYDWPASKTFYTNQYNGHFGRALLARVAAVEETALTLDRPVSHDLYADEPVQIRKTGLVSGIGIQNLTITGAPGVKMDPVFWENIADSWLLRVAIRKPANWPLGYGSNFRLNCEIRECVFDGTQANINNGSTAYLGWSGVMTDCLMVGSKANDLRHMGIFQGAIRCAIRDCTFTGKTVRSPQFHGQFPHDNLIEGTTFDVKSEIWSVDGMATLRHGVQGPRNVLYHCRFPSTQGSAEFSGGVEGHIIAYNQWKMGDNENWRGSPVMAFDRTWNTIIRGNVVQADPRYPFASLNDQSCSGWEIRGNTVHGSNGLVAEGDGSVALNDANRILPLDAPLADPRPEAPSIIDWQRAHADKPRLVLSPLASSVITPGTTTQIRITRVKSDTQNPLEIRLSAKPADALEMPASATIPAGAGFADIEIKHAAAHGEVALHATADAHLADGETLVTLDAAPKPGEWLQAAGTHAASGLPEGWKLRDFGRKESTTTATWQNESLTLTGGGTAFATDRNIHIKWRAQLWQSLDGDGTITARFDSASPNAQTGLIIADDAAPLTEGTLVLTDGTVLSSGASNEGTAHIEPVRKGDGGKTPVWLRLSRKGGVFTAWRATAENPAEADWQKLAEVDVYADPQKGQEHYRSQAKWDRLIHAGIFLNTKQPGTPAATTCSHVSIK